MQVKPQESKKEGVKFNALKKGFCFHVLVPILARPRCIRYLANTSHANDPDRGSGEVMTMNFSLFPVT